MQYRILGRTGLRVSEIGVGGAQFGLTDYMGPWDASSQEAQQATTATIHRALELGYNYYDTAPGYGDGRSEDMVGRALEGRRDEVVLATKVSRADWGPEALRASVEASLRRLRTEVIDIIQFHGGWYPPEDVKRILDQGGLASMQALQDEGKVRFLGFTAEGPSCGVEKLIATGAFDVMQIRYNLLNQHPCDFINDRGVMLQAEAQEMGLVLMRPMTSGIFQRLMARTFPDLDRLAVGKLLLNYVLSNPYVDVALIGMREPRFVEINNEISNDVASRLNLAALHDRFVH
jgi:hypothetical protein